ncbi:hypothetical protein KFK09_005411 [Dendrobium nobile]|uniref:Uncharacterized protein n=1 Tax=Dendrobium nobile TaxID=94219 RepID=A0A8T3BYC0_DENNO|nr:hypothetical protein KFK09_005411 [Dendrobium nobile]
MYFMEQRMVTDEHQIWLSKLLGYDFEIHYRPCMENKETDALSKCMGELQVIAVSILLILDWEAINKESAWDKELGRIRANLLKEGNIHPGYSLDGERMLYQGRFILPRISIHILYYSRNYMGA